MHPDPYKDAEEYAQTCARAAHARRGIRPESAGLVRHRDELRYFADIRPLRKDAKGGQWEIKLFTGEKIRVSDGDILRHPAGMHHQGKLFDTEDTSK